MNRRIAITGGTSGLGLALVRELTRRGERVAFVARHADALARVVRENPGAVGIAGDVSRKGDIYPIATQILGNLGGLDVLVNNASALGPVPLALLADTECEDFEVALDTNVLGPFRLTKALLGALAAAAREGYSPMVLNISSDAAVNPYARWGAYSASKAALHHMTRVWDEELASEGIRFLSPDPGDMDTPLHALAVPEADRASLKRPEDAARELADIIAPVRAKQSRMIAASLAVQRPADARLLVAGPGTMRSIARRDFASLLRPGDLVVANDAATLPASLHGTHVATGDAIEVRLAAARSLDIADNPRFAAIVFGAGDYRTRTEDRPLPPPLAAGDKLALGPVSATVERVLDHPRFIELRLEGSSEAVWAAIAHHGRPIQYAHVPAPLAAWDVWTPIAAAPLAFEAPSAGFTLDWRALAELRERGAGFATLTLAAGISSTGDAALDARLPFDEPYRVPAATVAAIRQARRRGARVIAIGTTVVRALESAAAGDGEIRAGGGIATLRVGAGRPLQVVDAILSGTHERGTSHFELLRAFAGDATLERMAQALDAGRYRSHEFGDSVFIEKSRDVFAGARSVRHPLRGLV